MADILISDLGAMAEAVHKDKDMLALQNDSSGETVKVSTQQLLDTVSSLTAMTDAVATTDVLVIHDTSAGVTKKVTPQQLFDIVPSLVIQGRDGGDIGGYLCDGVDDYLVIPHNSQLNIGTSDFTIEFYLNPTVFASNYLLAKADGTAGYVIQITDAGTIYPRLKKSGGSMVDYTTSPITLILNQWQHIIMTFDRDGNYKGYLNGVEVTSIDISGSAGDLSCAIDMTFGYSGTAFYNGKISLLRMYNRVLTPAETASIYNNGRPDLYILPFELNYGALVYTSDFSVNSEKWDIGSAVTTTGNVDGISGIDNCLSAVPDNTLNVHIARMIDAALFSNLVGKTIKIQFDYYLPSANSNVDGFQLYEFGYASGIKYDAASTGATPLTPDTWTTVKTDSFTVTQGTGLYLYLTDGATDVFQDAGGDDLLYLKNITITVIGTVAEYLPQNAGSLGWIESSGNQLSSVTVGSPICLTKEARPPHYRDIRKTIAANTNTTLTSIVPRGYKIVSIRAKGSDSLADIKIGSASAGEQIVAATTTSSTTPKLLTLAATANDAYSESADVTLYARHDTSASGKTMDLIFHFEKVGN